MSTGKKDKHIITQQKKHSRFHTYHFLQESNRCQGDSQMTIWRYFFWSESLEKM